MHSETPGVSGAGAPRSGSDIASLGWRGVLVRLLPSLLVTIVANTLIAVLLTAVMPPPRDDFFSTFVYSQCIGLSILLLVVLPRLTFWPRENFVMWQVALHLAGATVVGFAAGSYGASLLLGEEPLIRARAPGDNMLLVVALVTILASVGCSSFFWLRERVAGLQLEASSQRERAEAERARAEAASRQATEARLNLIRTQLEPHMLFNTLANLRSLMAIDPPRAQAMVDHLIAFLRATLAASRHDKVTLREEFELLRDYLELISIRMGSRLQYSLALPPELAATTVLPLLLQPLVENAVRHGIEPAIEGGRIDVWAQVDGPRLKLVVQDSGMGFSDGAVGGVGGVGEVGAARGAGTGFGLAQVRERLRTAYGEAASLAIETALPANPGTRVTLCLPLTVLANPSRPVPDAMPTP